MFLISTSTLTHREKSRNRSEESPKPGTSEKASIEDLQSACSRRYSGHLAVGLRGDSTDKPSSGYLLVWIACR